MKKCSCCGETKSLDDFHRSKNAYLGRNNECRVCRSKKNKDHYDASSFDRDLARVRYQRDSEHYRANRRRSFANNPEAKAAKDKAIYQTLRTEVRRLLGNKCTHCNYTGRLDIDHVNDDGREDRERFGAHNSSFLRHVIAEIKAGSSRFQLLCRPCHRIKSQEDYANYIVAKYAESCTGLTEADWLKARTFITSTA